MNWLYYIAEANLYLGVFYLAYCILLHHETFYQLNRVYLLSACTVAFIIPLVQLGFLKPVEYVAMGTTPAYQAAPTPTFTWPDALVYAYIIGVVFFAARFMLKLHQLKQLINNNPVTKVGNYKLVGLQDTGTAFSFFNYLFVGTQSADKALITRHELVHIRQKHSVDIVFVELVQIISWFNPLVYLLQNSLKTVHEYVADEQTAQSENDTIAYATYLLNNAYGISGPAITHSFFNYNLLKKRITMLHQKRSGSLARLKYLVAAPLCAVLLCQSTLGFSKTYALITIAPKAVVVIGDTIPTKKQALIKPKGMVEQVLVEDENGKLISISSKKGKAIHAKNLLKEKAEAKKGASYMVKPDMRIDETIQQETEVKDINKQNPPLANVEKTLNDKVKGLRVSEQKSEIRIDEPVSEIRMEEPAQEAPKKQKAPKPDVKKIKFPPPIVKKAAPGKAGKLPPPPPPPLDKRNKNDVKFPPPIVKPGAPGDGGKLPPLQKKKTTAGTSN